MAKWRPIVYRDFYDVPRAIIVSDETRNYFFSSSFDETSDEYPDFYEIYELPKLSAEEIKGSWLNFEQKAIQHLGRISIKDVQFDVTKRQEIDLEILAARN